MKRAVLWFSAFWFLSGLASPAAAQSPVRIYGTTSTGVVVPLLASASGSNWILSVSAAISGTVDPASTGATIASTQVSVTTSSTQLLAASTTRRAATFTNHSTSVNVFIGPTGVTTANGILLTPGSSATFSDAPRAAYFAVAASGTQTVGTLAESN